MKNSGSSPKTLIGAFHVRERRLESQENTVINVGREEPSGARMQDHAKGINGRAINFLGIVGT